MVGKASKTTADGVISGVELDVFSICIACLSKVINSLTSELDSAMSSPKGILYPSGLLLAAIKRDQTSCGASSAGISSRRRIR